MFEVYAGRINASKTETFLEKAMIFFLSLQHNIEPKQRSFCLNMNGWVWRIGLHYSAKKVLNANSAYNVRT